MRSWSPGRYVMSKCHVSHTSSWRFSLEYNLQSHGCPIHFINLLISEVLIIYWFLKFWLTQAHVHQERCRTWVWVLRQVYGKVRCLIFFSLFCSRGSHQHFQEFEQNCWLPQRTSSISGQVWVFSSCTHALIQQSSQTVNNTRFFRDFIQGNATLNEMPPCLRLRTAKAAQ